MGAWFGTWGYFVFYPSLWHPRCWLPTPRKRQLAWEAKWALLDAGGAPVTAQESDGGKEQPYQEGCFKAENTAAQATVAPLPNFA